MFLTKYLHLLVVHNFSVLCYKAHTLYKRYTNRLKALVFVLRGKGSREDWYRIPEDAPRDNTPTFKRSLMILSLLVAPGLIRLRQNRGALTAVKLQGFDVCQVFFRQRVLRAICTLETHENRQGPDGVTSDSHRV